MTNDKVELHGVTISVQTLKALYEMSHSDAWNDFARFLDSVDSSNATQSLVNPGDVEQNWARTGEYRLATKIRDIPRLTEQKIGDIKA